jgi:predicted metal-dependent phosphoesterase TrpH
MHVHTSHSHDGVDPPKAFIERAAGMGLDGLAITDHNTQEGVGEALDAGREMGIIVVPGIEVSCKGGHVLLYGCEDFGLGKGRDVGETLTHVRNSFPGCIAAPAHPFDFYRAGMGWAAADHDFHAVETVNAHSPVPRGVVRPLARKLGAGEVGGSDTHVLEGLGKGRTVVPPDQEALLDGIARSGRAEGGFDLLGIIMAQIRRRNRPGG